MAPIKNLGKIGHSVRTLCGTPHAAESAPIAPNPSQMPATKERKNVWSTGRSARSFAVKMIAASIAGALCMPDIGLGAGAGSDVEAGAGVGAGDEGRDDATFVIDVGAVVGR